MAATSVGQAVRAALDPILTQAGFAKGQGGGESGTDPYAQIIFCMGHDEFSDRYPNLAPANAQQRGLGACVDLVLTVSVEGKIESVDLEGHTLETVLRHVGGQDAGEAADLLGQPLSHGLPTLKRILRRLFEQQASTDVSVSLLADYPASVPAVAHMRWQEWGRAPESEDPAWWLDISTREAGRDDLPVTFVAQNAANEVLGAVGLDRYDLDERRETSPWVTGMIVRRDHRRKGVGRILIRHLERWAAEHGIGEAWVGTDLAREFYEQCGWTQLETFTNATGQQTTVLHKKFS